MPDFLKIESEAFFLLLLYSELHKVTQTRPLFQVLYIEQGLPDLHFISSLCYEGRYSKSRRLLYLHLDNWLNQRQLNTIHPKLNLYHSPNLIFQYHTSANASSVHPRTSHKPSKHPWQRHLLYLPYLIHFQVLQLLSPERLWNRFPSFCLRHHWPSHVVQASLTGSLLWPGTVFNTGRMGTNDTDNPA